CGLYLGSAPADWVGTTTGQPAPSVAYAPFSLHSRGSHHQLSIRAGGTDVLDDPKRLEYNPYRAFSSPYVIFGAMGERKLAAHVKVFLNLENLGNVRQSRWDPMLLPGRAVDGRWTVDAWAPLERRVINGGIRFIF